MDKAKSFATALAMASVFSAVFWAQVGMAIDPAMATRNLASYGRHYILISTVWP